LLGRHASAVCLYLGDVTFARQACHLNDVIFVYTENN
jgi:hypothetical protein